MPEPAKKRIGDARGYLVLLQPFFGVLASMLEIVEDTNMVDPVGRSPTMGTDGNRIYYHPKFVDSVTNKQLRAVLMHELLHVIYAHTDIKRVGSRDRVIWNIGCDFVINWEIKAMGKDFELPKSALLDDSFKELTAEQAYEKVKKWPKQKRMFCTLDQHIFKNLPDTVKEKILAAAEISKGMQHGTLPYGVQQAIDALRRAKVRWERVFHKLVGSVLLRTEYSFSRPNRRFLGSDIYLPSESGYGVGRVVVAADTSGSVGQEDRTQFASEIVKIAHLVEEVTVITCDAMVHEVVRVYDFHDFLNKRIQFKGGGGTDFRPVFDTVAKQRLNPELLIFLTDLCGTFPQEAPRYPVLWVSTSGPEAKAPWGVTLPLK